MRPLTEAEQADYGLPARVSRRVRVQPVKRLAPGAGAMTLGRIVFVRRDLVCADGRIRSPELLAHELVHVLQYARLGVAAFLWRYLREYLTGLWRLRNHRRAYLAISLEVQARDLAKLWASTGRSLASSFGPACPQPPSCAAAEAARRTAHRILRKATRR